MRTLFYALGGGLGHVTRQLAIARKLMPLIGGEGLLITNSQFAAAVEGESKRCAGLSLQRISANAAKNEVAQFVSEQLATFNPELMLVDTFPRGIAGELAEIFAAKPGFLKTVLIGRNLPREYVETYDLFGFAQAYYDLVFVPGEISVWESFPGRKYVPPIVLRGTDEYLPAEESAKILRISPNESCVLIIGSGNLAEIFEQDALVAELAACWPQHWPYLRWAIPPGIELAQLPFANSRPNLVVQHYPLSELFAAAWVLVGGAGYNLIHEARSHGLPLFAKAHPRLYDDQALRAAEAGGLIQTYESLGELHSMLGKLFESERLPVRQLDRMQDGAKEAAKRIAGLQANS